MRSRDEWPLSLLLALVYVAAASVWREKPLLDALFFLLAFFNARRGVEVLAALGSPGGFLFPEEKEILTLLSDGRAWSGRELREHSRGLLVRGDMLLWLSDMEESRLLASSPHPEAPGQRLYQICRAGRRRLESARSDSAGL